MKHITREFVMAGKATFTVQLPAGSPKPHFTYQVNFVPGNAQWPEAYFVKLMTGPDNNSSFSRLGKLDPRTGQTRTVRGACRPENSLEVRLLNRILFRVWGEDHAAYESCGYRTGHAGRCGRCGRKLTTPDSLDRGIGPECAGIIDARRPRAITANDDQVLREPVGDAWEGEKASSVELMEAAMADEAF